MAIITSTKDVNSLIITITLSIVTLIGGLTWICISADRSIKNVNQRTNQQIVDETYRSCVQNSQYAKVNECKKVGE